VESPIVKVVFGYADGSQRIYGEQESQRIAEFIIRGTQIWECARELGQLAAQQSEVWTYLINNFPPYHNSEYDYIYPDGRCERRRVGDGDVQRTN